MISKIPEAIILPLFADAPFQKVGTGFKPNDRHPFLYIILFFYFFVGQGSGFAC